jgi:hypothetical protein
VAGEMARGGPDQSTRPRTLRGQARAPDRAVDQCTPSASRKGRPAPRRDILHPRPPSRRSRLGPGKNRRRGSMSEARPVAASIVCTPLTAPLAVQELARSRRSRPSSALDDLNLPRCWFSPRCYGWTRTSSIEVRMIAIGALWRACETRRAETREGLQAMLAMADTRRRTSSLSRPSLSGPMDEPLASCSSAARNRSARSDRGARSGECALEKSRPRHNTPLALQLRSSEWFARATTRSCPRSFGAARCGAGDDACMLQGQQRRVILARRTPVSIRASRGRLGAAAAGGGMRAIPSSAHRPTSCASR